MVDDLRDYHQRDTDPRGPLTYFVRHLIYRQDMESDLVEDDIDDIGAEGDDNAVVLKQSLNLRTTAGGDLGTMAPDGGR